MTLFKFSRTYRVVDLDGLPGIEDVNVIRPSRPLSDGVFRQAENGVKVLAEAVADGDVKGAKNSAEK
jgi:hypothetical protein